MITCISSSFIVATLVTENMRDTGGFVMVSAASIGWLLVTYSAVGLDLDLGFSSLLSVLQR